ncbi:MAG: hypothetical protein MSS60_04755 [Clostridiales bacterium]|nr:hypothetical protein [Clostridiales bacterium]
MTVTDGIAYADLTWSSANYDYMIVDGVRSQLPQEAAKQVLIMASAIIVAGGI